MKRLKPLNRGEEKPRPKGKLGYLGFYNSGHESQQKEQLEQLRNSFENSYSGYLELDPKDLLDLIDNDLNEDLRYWGVKDDKMGPIKEDDEVTSLKGHRDHDDWVFIHRNLHRPPYYSIKSGRSGGPVIGYDTDIWLEDVTFKVQPGGRERTRKEMRRNVHAGVYWKNKRFWW